jgi:hypothetical protein
MEELVMTANTTVSIFRGTKREDEYGDTEDINRSLATHLPATISGSSAIERQEGSGSTQDVRAVVTLRFNLLPDDRVVDDITSETYQVQTVVRSPLSGKLTKADLIRISGKTVRVSS